MLLKSYCLSLYGSELGNLRHTSIDKLCKSFGAYNYGECSAYLMDVTLADTIFLYDVICQRSIMLIRRCLQSDSDLVKLVF